jgi:putative Mg2+ transporter-C (MgtC) family protein
MRLIIASILGGIIGLERDIHGRAAGLRTNMLISLGAAVFMIISEAIAVSFSNTIGESVLRADPSRIGAQIITGIGFLGAGAIIKSGFSVRGLTTAACIWISSGIGMSAGAGFFDLSVVATIISLFSLIILNKVEKIYAKDSYRILEIETSSDTKISDLLNVIKQKDIKILYFDNKIDYINKKMSIRLTLKTHYKDITDKLSHVIIKDLEHTGAPIYTIHWLHQ